MAERNSTSPVLFRAEGKVWTTSLDVAERFGKRHDNVLRDIQNLECSVEFNALNFEAVGYSDAKGEQRPCVRMTRDGFVFLAMGFTGKEAAIWKERYIAAFNAMERQLQSIDHEIRASIIGLYDRLGSVSEVVALNMQMLSVTASETAHKVEQTSEKVESIDKRLGVVESNVIAIASKYRRREISKKTRSEHLYVHAKANYACFICHERCDKPEFDHYYSSSQPDFQHTWPPCPECHGKLTRGELKRGEVRSSFDAYQEFAARVLQRQRQLI